MKTFKETDVLSWLRAGDRLEMNDGTAHLAVKDTPRTKCAGCSMLKKDYCLSLRCVAHNFHFKQIKP